MKILTTHKRYRDLGAEISSHKFIHFEDKSNSLVLYYSIIPWIVSDMKNTELRRSKKYYLLGSIPSKTAFSLFWKDYDIFIDRNIFGLSTLLHLLISSLRFKKNGIIVKEWFWRKESIAAKLNNYIAKYITAELANFYISYSKESTSFLINEIGIRSKKVFEVPKPYEDYSKKQIDKDTLQSIKNRYFGKNKISILTVNRLVPFKGVHTLIKAINDKENINLVIVGDAKGDYAEFCKKLSEDSKADITFTGHIPSEKVIYFYKCTDVYVQPNKYYPEEFEPLEVWGSVVDEAMSLEIPVIATTATGSARDLIKNQGSGSIIKQGDIEALKKEIDDFIENRNDWKEKGKKARQAFLRKNERGRNNFKRLIEHLENS